MGELTEEETLIIEELRKLGYYGTLTITKAEGKIKFIERTDKIKVDS